MDAKIYTVSEISRLIRNILEDSFPVLWIEGEVSNYRPHYSGHLYFTLKDPEAQISCVMWRTRAASLAIDLEDGQNVRIFGNIRVYEKGGRYQVDILRIEPAGIGQLQVRFEQLKQKLNEEGLFDPDHKKSLPRFPASIGIVTSPTGAAIQDILSVLSRRSPSTRLILSGVKVQGEGAAQEIADALVNMDKSHEADVIIVGRGGGSLEDLWPFNEEIVARAIYACNIPVISAVGHEIDFTISDFVADVRAATPSAAAEIVVQSDYEIKQLLWSLRQTLNRIVFENLSRRRTQLENYKRTHAFRQPENIIRQLAQRVDELSYRLNLISRNRIDRYHMQVERIRNQIKALNPENVLKRGFSMTIRDNRLVTSVGHVKAGDEIVVRLQDGHINSTVKSTQND